MDRTSCTIEDGVGRKSAEFDRVAEYLLGVAREAAHRRFRKDFNAAEEIAQMAIVRAFRQYGKVDPERSLDGWVKVLLGNAASEYFSSLRRWRSYARELPTFEDDEGDVWQMDAPDPRDGQEEVIAGERRAALARGLAACDPTDVEIMTLRHVRGLTFREIGPIMNCAERTAQTRFGPAEGRVRQVLEEHGLRAFAEEASGPADFAGEEVLTQAEAAAYKGVSYCTITDWVRKRRVRKYLKNGSAMYARRQLDRIEVREVYTRTAKARALRGSRHTTAGANSV